MHYGIHTFITLQCFGSNSVTLHFYQLQHVGSRHATNHCGEDEKILQG